MHMIAMQSVPAIIFLAETSCISEILVPVTADYILH